MFKSHERAKTKYVGRKKEAIHLEEILNEVARGKGRLVMVAGEAGIGKTRFSEEIRELEAFKDFTYLWGRCLYFKDTDVYLPFKEMFNQYKKIKEFTIEDELDSPFSARSGPSFEYEGPPGSLSDNDFVPMSLIPAEIEAEEDQESNVDGVLRFDRLSEFIFQLAREGPLCLLIDDLHWADPPSLQMLQYLAHKITDQPILIICTYRPEDLFWGEDKSHPLAESLKRLGRDRLFTPIKLGRLVETEVEEMLQNLLGITEVPPDFSKLIYERTMGNPFFVEEVVYSLLERGLIDPQKPDGFKKLDPEKISLPTTLKDVILRRVHWLKPVSIKLIRFASVAGPKFTFDIVKESLELNDEETLEALEELIQAKFIVEGTEEEHYEFENPVIQEVIYSELNHSRRKYLHSKMAKVLENHYSDIEEYWDDIAINYYKAKDFQNSLVFLIKAASYYQSISPVKALELLHMIIECNNRLPQNDVVRERNMEVFLEISDLCLRLSDWKTSLEFAERALSLSTVLKKPDIEVRAKLNKGHVFIRTGDYQSVMDNFNQAIELSRELDDQDGIAQGFMGLGYMHWRNARYHESLEMFSRSLKHAKVNNNLRTIGTLYVHIGNLFNHRGALKKAIEYYKRGIRHLQSTNSRLETARGFSNMGNAYMQMGKIEEAEDSFRLALESSKEVGTLYHWAGINMIEIKCIKYGFKAAKEEFEAVIDPLTENDEKVAVGVATMYMATCLSKNGLYEEAEGMFTRSLKNFRSVNAPYDVGRAKLRFGEHYLRNDRTAQATSLISEALEIFRNIGAKHYEKKAVDVLCKADPKGAVHYEAI